MPSSVMPSKTMVHEATAHEWMHAAAHHHGDDRAAPAEPLDAPAEPLDADLYYINLQRRPDRNAALLRQLDRVGYDRAHVHRINATAHADDPMAETAWLQRLAKTDPAGMPNAIVAAADLTGPHVGDALARQATYANVPRAQPSESKLSVWMSSRQGSRISATHCS